MRHDALEAEKIKSDLSRLRQEIEQADLEDEQGASMVLQGQRLQPDGSASYKNEPDYAARTDETDALSDNHQLQIMSQGRDLDPTALS